jgi:hypothetical protein
LFGLGGGAWQRFPLACGSFLSEVLSHDIVKNLLATSRSMEALHLKWAPHHVSWRVVWGEAATIGVSGSDTLMWDSQYHVG